MSLKASTSKDVSGRIMTRQKTAQLQRQLRSSEVIKKKPQEPVQQNPAPATKASKTVTPKSKKITKNAITKTEKNYIKTEFHPEKLKRKAPAKKVFLKPRHEMKPIVNKRKFGLPQKDRNSSLAKRFKNETASGVSKHELIQLKDDGGLDEDEFLEILTCESPVFWEDLPSSNETSKEDNAAESMYGHISDHLLKNTKKSHDQGINKSVDVHIDIDPVQVEKLKHRYLDKNDNHSEYLANDESSIGSEDHIDDAMVKALENSYIPIENQNTPSTEDVIVLDDSSQDTIESNKKSSQSRTSRFETIKIRKPDESVETYYLEDVTLTANSPEKSKYSELIEQSKATSSFVITSIEKESISSPITIKSDDSIDDDCVVSDLVNNDGTISDALIQYIDRRTVQANNEKESDKKILNQNESFDIEKKDLAHSANIKKNGNLMYVFKIISSEDCKESFPKETRGSNSSSDKNTFEDVNVRNKRLDAFFKKCKNTPKSENHTGKSVDNKSLLFPTESKENLNSCVTSYTNEALAEIATDLKNIKYCLRCSSLFESYTCRHDCHAKQIDKNI